MYHICIWFLSKYVWVIGYGRVMGYDPYLHSNQLGNWQNLWVIKEYGLWEVWIRREMTVVMTGPQAIAGAPWYQSGQNLRNFAKQPVTNPDKNTQNQQQPRSGVQTKNEGLKCTQITQIQTRLGGSVVSVYVLCQVWVWVFEPWPCTFYFDCTT